MTGSYTIRSGALEGSLKEDFQKLPYALYPGPVAAHKNDLGCASLLVTTIVVYNNDVPSGRVCLYHNPCVHHHYQPTLLFGHFECLDDLSCCRVLLQAAEAEAGKHHARFLLGPLNGSTWDAYRCVLGPQHQPYLSEEQQPAWYAEMLAACGYTIAERYYTFLSDIHYPEELAPISEGRFRQQGIHLRPVRAEAFREELKALYPLCNKAFTGTPYFSPIREDDFIHRYMQLLPLVDPDFVWIAETDEEERVAFAFAFRDSFHPERLVLKTVAKSADHTLPGLISVIGTRLYERAYARGCTRVLHAYMHEHNRSLLRSRDFGGSIYRAYGLFLKPLPA